MELERPPPSREESNVGEHAGILTFVHSSQEGEKLHML